MSEDKQISSLLDRLNIENYSDRIDAIMEVSSNDHDEIIERLIEIATGKMRGEIRVAAAIGLCDHPSKAKIDFIEKYLNNPESGGWAVTGGDRKATVALILAIMDDSYDLGQVLEKHPDVKREVLEYIGKADRDYKKINSKMGQIGYLIAWCAGIDMGYGDRSFIEYVGHKTKSSKKLVSSILEWM